LAQRIQDERAVVVDLQVEQVVGVDRGGDRAGIVVPLVAVPVDRAHQLVDRVVALRIRVVDGVVGEEALLLGVHELVPAGVALVEPDVAPLVGRDRRCRGPGTAGRRSRPR
jgi:hypothetical protein